MFSFNLQFRVHLCGFYDENLPPEVVFGSFCQFDGGHKKLRIKERDSAQNNCKPLQTVWSIVLEMRPRSFSPVCRTFNQRVSHETSCALLLDVEGVEKKERKGKRSKSRLYSFMLSVVATVDMSLGLLKPQRYTQLSKHARIVTICLHSAETSPCSSPSLRPV
ncbi:hypothetical protein NQZ68_020244 [Dissostichus eleginoides]|nr:hypothetical protein NQZ68_020244 [Dissostichus eleginoides]